VVTDYRYTGFLATHHALSAKKNVKKSVPVSVQIIERKIYLIRNHKVMIDVGFAKVVNLWWFASPMAVFENGNEFLAAV
jgi:hypothetical protein